MLQHLINRFSECFFFKLLGLISEVLQPIFHLFEVTRSSLSSHLFEFLEILLSFSELALKLTQLLIYIIILLSLPVCIRRLE